MRKAWCRLAGSTLGAWLLLSGCPVASSHVRVIDGDTLEINDQRVRLYGVDAPESGQRCAADDGGTWGCGAASTQRLKQLVRAGDVSCDAQEQTLDRFRRLIATCRAGQTDLNATMVREGLAWAYRRYADDYIELENLARAEKLGIWQERTVPAWIYRRSANR